MKTENEDVPSGRNFVQLSSREDCGNQKFDLKITDLLEERRAYFLRYLQSRLGDRDEAEDVLQDFCIRVLAKAGQIRDEDSTLAWLRAVLKSVLADHFRRRATERNGHQQLVAEWLAIRDEPETPTAGQEEFDRTECTCLHKMLPRLKAEYADVLSRVDLAQESRKEVAHALGMTPGNVRVRLHRARHALKDALEHSCRKCKERGCFEGTITH